MFDSQVLDVAIGLIFVYLFLSLTCSVINEGIASILKVRAKQLYKGLFNLLREKNVLDKLYEHPLFMGIAPKKEAEQQSEQKLKKYYPSYISSRNFALALVEGVKAITIEKEKERTGQEPKIPMVDTFLGLRSLVADLPADNEVRRSLLPLIDAAQGNLENALKNIEKWYDDAMDRLTGWFKRYSQIVVLILAVLVSAFLNADTFMIGKTLYQDQAMRASIVAAAQGVAQKPISEDQTKFLKELQEKVKPLKLPLGWVCSPETDPRAFPKGYDNWLIKIFGLLFTALAISLGAPFWFDVLNKVTNLRGAGKKPLTAEEEEKGKRRT
jgi:hypothetical protein